MTQNGKNTNIFDNYEVDCNGCECYWDNSCDGVPLDKKRNCTSYTATRTTDIPMRIADLKHELIVHRSILAGLTVGILTLATLLAIGV